MGLGDQMNFRDIMYREKIIFYAASCIVSGQ